LFQVGVLLDNQKVGSLGSPVTYTCQQESSDSVLDFEMKQKMRWVVGRHTNKEQRSNDKDSIR
jgi:hypothetical protein